MLRKIIHRLRPEAVQLGSVKIPARHLRQGGQNFADDRTYIETARKEVQKLQTSFGLRKGSRLVEIGCGSGRLPIGLFLELGSAVEYHGIDVNPRFLGWARKYVEPLSPQFQFSLIDVKNNRYNPQGRVDGQAAVLPVEDRSADVVYLYSVFSHMLTDDVQAYMIEIKRILKESGSVFLTLFMESGVPNVEENPTGYLRSWSGALHCVRYNDLFFRQMAESAGLNVTVLGHQSETDGQSLVRLTHS